MVSVLAELRSWASTLPYWEQYALEMVMSGRTLGDFDYDQLLQYLLEDAGLTAATSARKTLSFAKSVDDQEGPVESLRLLQISNLKNINALAADQTLTFGPQMTVVFGANGSGKSGYARVLGCAAFSRGDQEVLPNISESPVEPISLSADVAIAEGEATRQFQYEIGQECVELSSCYVFDSTSVRSHLSDSHALSFSPASLAYLTRLAQVTDAVRARLKERIDLETKPLDIHRELQGESEVKQLLKELGASTDLEQVRSIAAATSPEQIAELDIEIARLKARNIPREQESLLKAAKDLSLLVTNLRSVRAALNDEAMEHLGSAVRRCLLRPTVSQLAGLMELPSTDNPTSLVEDWSTFLHSARKLSEALTQNGKPYPQEDSKCLLCRQPLMDEARDLLNMFWRVLESQSVREAEDADRALEEASRSLAHIKLDFFDDQSVSRRYLHEHYPDVAQMIDGYIEACQFRKDAALSAVKARRAIEDPPKLPASSISDLESIATSLHASIEELSKMDVAGKLAAMETAARDLQHRAFLSQHLDDVSAFVERCAWASRASSASRSTAHITRKHNELFKILVTDRYIRLFEERLQTMGRPLSVSLSTRGRKGEVYRQIIVQSDSDSLDDRATPDKVLSEGEKRAVALADFLTEVSLDTSSCAVILDDPVTSLDMEWRRRIAQLLADEARKRQVIIFTHDLVFLYYTKSECEAKEIQLAAHWMKRGDSDGKPGYVFLDNSPSLERDYRKPTRAQDIYARAKSAPAERQEALLRDGFGALRTSYEALIVFDIFNEVVQRFEERISVGRLRDVVWDKDLITDVMESFERLSRFIEGHLHSDALADESLSCPLLRSEIEHFDDIRRRLRALKKEAK